MSDNDALARALQKAALARALNPDDPNDSIRQAAAKLDMTVADLLRLIAGMLDRLTAPSETLH
jgi:hypothetical protein